MFRTLTTACLAAAALIAPSVAMAQDGGSSAWSFSLGAATDNRSKDASKSDGEPYVWGEAMWESADGRFYAGPAFETIKSGGSDLEVDIGAGFRPEWAGFDWDLNATHKWRVDADPGQDADAWEFTADMKRDFGRASTRLRIQHSPDGTGSTEAWTWYGARVGWDFTDKLTATAEIGRREQDNSIDYTGGNVGVAYALTDALELDIRYHATDAAVRSEQYADQFVIGVSASF